MSTELKRYSIEHRYSDTTAYNGVVYVVGQVPETTLDVSIAKQTAEVLATIGRVLATNGSDKTRILMYQILLEDISEIGETNKVWDQWVVADSEGSPPHTTVEATLTNPKYRTEIAMTTAQKN